MKKSTDSVEKVANDMAKALDKRPPRTKRAPRKDRSDDVSDMLLQCTLTVRQNIKAIIDAEELMDVEDPLNYNQLGKLAGWGAPTIYQYLRSEPPRHNIGIETIVRLALAINVMPHQLLLPVDDFKKTIIPAYKTARIRTAKKK